MDVVVARSARHQRRYSDWTFRWCLDTSLTILGRLWIFFFFSRSLTSRAAGGSTVDLDTIRGSLCGTWIRAAMYRSHSSLRKVVCPMFGYKCLWPSRVLCFTDSFDYRVDLWRAGCMVRQNVLLWSKHTKRGINCRFIFFIHDVAILVSWRG